ncbi:hypothetical protein K440DRAFT_646227 [Wilcoxina mikolae CBS 423.85]|nr:hypothetical protein K440DRAFT_646227 [Wilcoxina mikolae CBS 423.85]
MGSNDLRTPSPMAAFTRLSLGDVSPDPRSSPHRSLRDRVEDPTTFEQALIEGLSSPPPTRRIDGVYSAEARQIEEPFLGVPNEFLSQGFRGGLAGIGTPISAPGRLPFRVPNLADDEISFNPQVFPSPFTTPTPINNNENMAPTNRVTAIDNARNQQAGNIQAQQQQQDTTADARGHRRDPSIPNPVVLQQGQFRGRGRQFPVRGGGGGRGNSPQFARGRGGRGVTRIPSGTVAAAPRVTVTAPTATGRPVVHQDPHHPVFPESEKISVYIYKWEKFRDQPGFNLTAAFRREIGMASEDDPCNCQPGGNHYCCGECKYVNTILIKAEHEEYESVLAGFEFNEHPDVNAIQLLFVLIHNLPLALQVLSLGMRRLARNPTATLTLFFEDVRAVHRFVSHLCHACVAYNTHEDFVTHRINKFGLEQTVRDELPTILAKKGGRVIMRGYLQGGVGHSLIQIKDWGTDGGWELAVWVGDGGKGVLAGARCRAKRKDEE